MAKFSFKSSGTRIDDRSVSKDIVTKKSRDIGIKTPLSNAQGRQIFDMHQDPLAQIKDNLRNLILTNSGERLGLYGFGADLNAILFEFTNDKSVEAEIVERIQRAVERYMPGVSIREISEVELDKKEKEEANRMGMAKVRLRITYDIPNARVGNQGVEVVLQAGG